MDYNTLKKNIVSRKSLEKVIDPIYDLSIKDFLPIITRDDLYPVNDLLRLIIAICKYYEFDYDSLISSSRKQPIPYARFIFAKLSLDINPNGNANSLFVKQDHCFMDYAIGQIDKSIDIEGDLAYDYLNVIDLSICLIALIMSE